MSTEDSRTPRSRSGSQDREDNKNTKEVQSKDEPKPSQEQKPMRYATRGTILTKQQEDVQKQRDKIFSMKISEKRKLYKCKSGYTELKDVPAWPEYYTDVVAPDPDMKAWLKRNNKNVRLAADSDLNAKMSLFRGDITTLEIDAIVNAANESLLGGGGVDGAIHSAAGINLLHECELLNGCSPGDAKITCGYKLPAKHVVHTVGPRGERPEVLASCYKTSLDLLKENELKSIAFPCISTGIFGYPNLNAAKVALETIRHWLDTEEYAKEVERIIFCLFLEKDVTIYHEQMQLFFPLGPAEAETGL